MPDILDVQKSQIRELAKQYAFNLWKTSFNDGLIIYVKTNEQLYIHPARWKICLKCGEINKKEVMTNHSCLMDVEDFPILIQTSWYRLKDFFLSDAYKLVLKEVGVDLKPTASVIVKQKEDSISDAIPLKETLSEQERT